MKVTLFAVAANAVLVISVLHRGLGNLGEHYEPRIRHRDDADVRIDRAKGIIRRHRLASARDGVEESGFTHVGQTDDACFEHRV